MRPARPDAKALGGRAVVNRAHLSIGEVLSLLQLEFPDVTISKIRFLESQGLVDPERTPSGYRKFYEADIDRLRWVLRQQRDAFLPLKVIKGRLDNQGDPQDGDGDGAMVPDLETEFEQGEVIVEVLSVETSFEAAASVEAGSDAMEVVAGEPERPDAEEPQAGVITGPEAQLFETGPALGSNPEPGGPEERPGLHRRSPAGQRATARAIGGRQATRHGQRRSDGAVAAREERPPGTHRAAGGRAGRPDSASEGRGGADQHELTLDELLEEAGVDVEAVRELEGFGLVTAKLVGGAPYYTRDAVTVARLASAFARHGVEARHLRAYKGAADREAGLIEQVIMPLIRQRNPDARQAAAEAVEELSHLGGDLRAALLRSALADLH